MEDICGGTITLADPAALPDWNGVVHGFLAHSAATPAHLDAVLARDPQCAMALTVKGFALLMLARRELEPVARSAFQDATQAARHTTLSTREQGWLTALGQWRAGRPTAALATLENVVRASRHDTLTAKLIHGIRFILGDSAGLRTSVETVLPAHGPDHPLRGYLLGCHAFALEETGDYAAAEAAGREGLSLARDDAWGLHAVAHVCDMTADSARGIDLIAKNQSAWSACNNFRYHVWWHKALLHLDLGQTDAALLLYDTKIRAEQTDDYRDIANATSLLQRLELEGIDVGARWTEIADLVERRTEDGSLVFADLHYMLALAGASRPGARKQMIDRMSKARPHAKDESEKITAHPGFAAAQGLSAFGEGRYGTAFAMLSAARPALQQIGGSHAQRDVFERMTVDAGLRAGRFHDVRRVLDERTARRAGHRDRFAERRYAQLDASPRAQRIPAQ